MKKKMAILLAIVLMIGTSVIGVTKHEKAYAKTAQMSIEIPKSVKKENEFTVRVLLDSDVNLYSVDAYLSYNPELLEFVPDSDVVTGSAGVLELKDTYDAETKNKEYEITFKAIETGKTEISFQEIYLIDYADMDYMEVVPSGKTFDIGVNKTVEMDARLEDLIVAPGELTEDFSPDQLDYEMHVGLDVDMVGVSAVPMDEGSVVESDIPERLENGKNVITIKVTALSGSVNIYTVTVYKEEISEESAEEPTTEEDTTETTENEAGSDMESEMPKVDNTEENTPADEQAASTEIQAGMDENTEQTTETVPY
ncbi:MAG: cadherin-like beta sandwich domain-containing protein [Clostridium sp.]|nr:cadherin-like beta sandwich domain-containing protein [Clostridium sp.]